MKKILGTLSGRLAALALAVLVAAAGILPAMVQASSTKEAYTYTVRIFAGAQGTISGGTVKTYENLTPGQRISFNQSEVSLKNGSKYYIRGIRESGKDNNTVARLSTITVNSDMDYVVAYGILGDAVSYTVNYQDADGNTLLPSETYYGNVGDRPVIAFQYIEGYFPNAYNLTGTLSANAAENVFTFTYREIAPETTAATTTASSGGGNRGGGGGNATTPTQPTQAGGGNATTPTQPTQAGGNAATPTQPAQGGENAGTAQQQPAQQPAQPEAPATPEQPTQAAQPTQAPEPTPETVPELVDINDPNTPLVNYPGAESSEAGETTTAAQTTAPETEEVTEPAVPQGGFLGTLAGMGTAAKVGIGVAAAAVLGLILWLIARRR